MTLSNILEGDNLKNYTITSDTGSSFKFGSCICKCLEMELNNTDDRFSQSSIRGNTITFTKNSSSSIYYIDKFQRENGSIKITAYDSIIKTETTFKHKGIKTPITLKNLLIKVLTQCSISYSLETFTNENYVIHNISELKGKTCRQVIEYCLDLAGCNGMIDENEKFVLLKYSLIEDDIDIETVLNFKINDETTHQVNNLLYKRSDMEFKKSNGTNKSIVLNSDNGQTRVNKLKAAGYDPEAIQKLVNKLL